MDEFLPKIFCGKLPTIRLLVFAFPQLAKIVDYAQLVIYEIFNY